MAHSMEDGLLYNPTMSMPQFLTTFNFWCIRNNQNTQKKKAASFILCFPLGLQPALSKVFDKYQHRKDLWRKLQAKAPRLVRNWYTGTSEEGTKFNHPNAYLRNNEPFTQFQTRFETALEEHKAARLRSGRGLLTARDEIDALEKRVTPSVPCGALSQVQRNPNPQACLQSLQGIREQRA